MLFVIEPWEILRCIWIFIYISARQEHCFLHAYASTAENHGRFLVVYRLEIQIAILLCVLSKFVTTIDYACAVVAHNGSGIFLCNDAESLLG